MKMQKNLIAVAVLGTSLLGCGTATLKATSGVAPKAKAPAVQSTISTGKSTIATGEKWGIGGFSVNGQYGNNFLTYVGQPIQMAVYLVGGKDSPVQPGYNYYWTHNGVLFSTQPSYGFSFTSAGVAQVHCRIVDHVGRTASGVVNFTVRRSKNDTTTKSPADAIQVDDSFKVKGPIISIKI